MSTKDQSLELFREAVAGAVFDIAYGIEGYNQLTLNETHDGGIISDMLETYLAGQYDGPYVITQSPMDDSFLVQNRDPLVPWKVTININLDEGEFSETEIN